MFHQFVIFMLDTVGHWGYAGIVLLMALESSFFPFPSEVVVPPAAYLAASGKMNLSMVILSGTFGSLIGAVFNYYIALKFGRPFFERYGKYLLINRQSLAKADSFFESYGVLSMFFGRLLPGIRQYISLPAGLTRMNMLKFSAATAIGSCLWVSVLAGLGYWFGRNQQAVMNNLHLISIVFVVACAAVIAFYWLRLRNNHINAERK